MKRNSKTITGRIVYEISIEVFFQNIAGSYERRPFRVKGHYRPNHFIVNLFLAYQSGLLKRMQYFIAHFDVVLFFR